MKKENKITCIVFHRTANVFLNNGIAGLYYYLNECQNKASFPEYTFAWGTAGDSLSVECDQLFELLELLYYEMGRELYDTSGKKARERADKYFFVEEPFSYTPFYKMKTYGLAALITNDPQPSPKKKDNATAFRNIAKDNPEFADNIARVYTKQGWGLKGYELSEDGYLENAKAKGDAKIFLNEPYIKITRLDPIKADYLLEGDEKCYLTGESFKKLMGNQNTSPFLKGLTNFDSFQSPTTQKVSWKAMYLSRFAPKLSLYSYVSGLDSLVCFLFDSDSLKNLYGLYRQYSTFYMDELQLIESSYMYNFKTHSFYAAKKGGGIYETPRDYARKNEIQFALLYTMYQQVLYSSDITAVDDLDAFLNLGIEQLPVSLVSFKADKFSGTLRPNTFKYFNNFKFILSVIIHLEKNRIDFGQILQSLKFIKNSERTAEHKYQLERIIRDRVLGKMLNGKSILSDICSLFYQCYTYLLSGDNIGYKNFNQLKMLVALYEPLTPLSMTKELQEKAFNLGTSIGRAIIDYEQPENQQAQKANAKAGRKYIISLQKSRTWQQFNDAIIRIQNKYQLSVKTELFKADLDEKNYVLVKQFAIIGALNQMNTILKPFKTTNNE